MDEENNNWQNNPIKMFGLLIPKAPGLVFRFGKVFLSFKRQANKGAKAFRKELISQGLDKKTANDLTQKYLEGSQLSKYIFNFSK